ncbi:metallophosphoesterase family protein [Tardiphaga sp. 862_B3_N1_1]|uniref:metallophosphoesterase family protein n=1 Tax=Tardiphaga sp. 862_B3_N1_1 TaxID=3240763 RepID=UPI003F888E16
MLRLLVLSDLHAYRPSEKLERTPSFLIASNKGNPANPLRGIPGVLKDEGLSVDWVLCPGDLADQADPDAQTFAWNELRELKEAVKAKVLLGAAGNHDLDSRLQFSDFDPKGHLQSLTPAFPGIAAHSDQYWARNYHIHKKDDVRLINLNSAAFHGFKNESSASIAEYRHGRVSERTIEAIVKDVKDEKFHTNILLTHHHPYRNEDIFDNDYSNMQMGGKLLTELTAATSSAWLVIHGHQHYPSLRYGPGLAYSSVIFSAGSITAKIVSPLSAEAPNQFYLITLETDGLRSNGWSPCGTVRAWSWVNRREWQPTPDGANIPDGAGFGCRDNIPSIVATICAFVKASTNPVTIDQLFAAHPHLQFVVRQVFDEVVKELKKQNVRCNVSKPFGESQLRKIDGALP